LQIGVAGGLADSIRIGSYAVAKDTRQYIGYTRADSGLFESSGDGDTPSTVLSGVAGIRIVNTAGTLASSQADNSVQLLTHIYNGGSRVALHASYSGNVGIGTASPGTKLDIQDVPANIDGLRVSGNATTDQSYGVRINAGTSSNDYAINVANQANSSLFRVRGDGNVGIAETSPLGKLHIKGSDTGVTTPSAQGNLLVLEDSENGLSILSSTAGAGYINFGDSDDNDIGMIIYGHSSNSMDFWTNASKRMVIDSAGAIQFNNYDSTNNTGTATYLLGTDASGNIVKTLSTPGGDPGPYLPLTGGTLTGTKDRKSVV
jgi:hypothetical protein